MKLGMVVIHQGCDVSSGDKTPLLGVLQLGLLRSRFFWILRFCLQAALQHRLCTQSWKGFIENKLHELMKAWALVWGGGGLEKKEQQVKN